MAVKRYSQSNAGRLSKPGRLRIEPEFLLGSGGSKYISNAITTVAAMAMIRKVILQPACSPIIRPKGRPNTIAMEVPPERTPNAIDLLPRGAIRTA